MLQLKGRHWILAVAFAMMALAASCMEVDAKIKEVSALENPQWTMVGLANVTQEEGWIQSICVTDNYIVCFENASNDDDTPDTLLAFYKNDYDEDGNPVERYSLAKSVTERDYYHGNGMTYNQNTNEILIAPYKAKYDKKSGILYRADGTTLKYKDSVKVAPNGWYVAAVDYDADNRQYILLEGDRKRNYKFVFTDESFQELHSFDIISSDQDIVCQDFAISGDYMLVITSPQEELGGASGLLAFSKSQESQLANYRIHMEEIGIQEAESIAEVSAGHILVAVGIQSPRSIGFFETELQAVFKVTTSVENGDVTGGHDQLDEGSDYTVTYTPDEDYELSRLVVDGVEQDITAYPSSYTFKNLSSDHTLDVLFTEIPKFEIITSAVNGFIDDSMLVRRDKDGTVNFRPKPHYEIDQILVDGQEIPNPQDYGGSYDFINVQGPHHIEVRYKELPSYPITTQVVNGTITKSRSKVYSDESFMVEYHSEEDYELSYVKLDGKWIQELSGGILDSYLFENVQESHEIVVVYQWKFMPYLIFGTLWVLALICGIIYGFYSLYQERERKRDDMIRRRIEDRLRIEREIRNSRPPFRP